MINQEFIDRMEHLNFTDEQKNMVDELVEDIKKRNGYKVRTGRPVTILKKNYHDMNFYSALVRKKSKEGNWEYGEKPVFFMGCEPPLDEKTMIKPLQFYESFYNNKNDKYHKIFCLNILEYELMDDEKASKNKEEQALREFRIFDKIEDDDLPF